MITIYALIDPRNDAVRYIGKAQDVAKRLRQHLNDQADTHKVHWITALRAEGLKPLLIVLETVVEADWKEAERRQIREHRARGCRLTNLTEGGDGLDGPSEQTREKLRALRLGRPASAETRAKMSATRTGRTTTPEHRANISKGQRGKIITPEQRRKIGDASRGRRFTLTEEQRRRIAERQRGKVYDAATRVKVGAATRARGGPSEACMEAARRANTGKKHSPETIARMKAAWERRRQRAETM